MIKIASLFSQLLHHFSRTEFAELMAKHQAERRAKGGVKVHVPLDHDDYMPSYVWITKAKRHDRSRRVVVWDERNQREIVLLTNHLEFGASTIAAIYKDRWEIEIFFKTLKQHLKEKTFIGTSENALRIQIWTALIALLLLKYLHHLSKFGWSMSNLATMLRLNLFTYRNLQQWLHDPFGKPPIPPVIQLLLPGLGQPTVS